MPIILDGFPSFAKEFYEIDGDEIFSGPGRTGFVCLGVHRCLHVWKIADDMQDFDNNLLATVSAISIIPAQRALHQSQARRGSPTMLAAA
jgi:hypothetical protein